MFHQNCRNFMTYQAQNNFHTISDFTKCCWLVMLVVGLIDIQHMQAVIKGFFFFFFFKNCYFFNDLEIQWPRNPELKSELRFCLSSTFIRGGKSQYWRKKSQLCFRANQMKPILQSIYATAGALVRTKEKRSTNCFYLINFMAGTCKAPSGTL